MSTGLVTIIYMSGIGAMSASVDFAYLGIETMSFSITSGKRKGMAEA